MSPTPCPSDCSRESAGSAWLAAPAGAIRRLTHNVWATNWIAAPLNAELFATWIEDGTALATVERKRAEAAARARLAGACLRGRLEGLEHGGGARLLLPPTTYHAWLELPPGWTNGLAFAAAAERRGVVVTPAEAFVASGRAPAGVRISLSAPRTRDALRRGLERVADALADGPRVAAGFCSANSPDASAVILPEGACALNPLARGRLGPRSSPTPAGL